MSERGKKHIELIDFFNELWNHGDDEKTTKMGYSETSSNIRMKACSDFMNIHNVSHVLDIGCGTGRLIDFLKVSDYKLDYYVGVDIFERNSEHVMSSLKDAGTNGCFMLSQYPVPEETEFVLHNMVSSFKGITRVTMVTALGIIGYGDLDNVESVKSLIYNYHNSDSGFITIPRVWDKSKQNENIRYFTDEEINYIAEESLVDVVRLFDHEYAFTWSE